MKISAHVLVENEENYVWFAIMSVLPFVDEVRIVDAGSLDRTYEILQSIQKEYPKKVFLTKTHPLTPAEYPTVRHQMLKDTSADWIIVVDGDEIWWNKSIETVANIIQEKGKDLQTIVTPFLTCIEDLYHVQKKSAGRYSIDTQTGHLTIHAINTKIPGLQVKNEYGKEGYFSNDIPIQELPKQKRLHINEPCFLHVTHLRRTSIHTKKVKRDIGVIVPSDFYYPEVFFRKHPLFVKNPWRVAPLKEEVLNVMLGMLRKIKRWIS